LQICEAVPEGENKKKFVEDVVRILEPASSFIVKQQGSIDIDKLTQCVLQYKRVQPKFFSERPAHYRELAPSIAYFMVPRVRSEIKYFTMEDSIIIYYIWRVLKAWMVQNTLKEEHLEQINTIVLPIHEVKEKMENDLKKFEEFIRKKYNNKKRHFLDDKQKRHFFKAVHECHDFSIIDWKEVEGKFDMLRETTGSNLVTVEFQFEDKHKIKEKFLIDSLNKMKEKVLEWIKKSRIKKSRRLGLHQRLHQRYARIDLFNNGERVDSREEISQYSKLTARSHEICINWCGKIKDGKVSRCRTNYMNYDDMRNWIGGHWDVNLDSRPLITLEYKGLELTRETYDHLRDGEKIEAYPEARSWVRNQSGSNAIQNEMSQSTINVSTGVSIYRQSRYDDVLDFQKLLIAFMELIDNAIRPTLESKSEKASIKIRFHRHYSEAQGRYMYSASIINIGAGMSADQLRLYWMLRYSQKDKGARSKSDISTRSFFFVDGRLNYFGEGAKDAIFLVARGGIVDSRIRGNNEVTCVSCSDDLIRLRQSKNDQRMELGQIKRQAGKEETVKFDIIDPCYKEYWESELAKELLEEEKIEKEFTRVVLYDIKPNLQKYLQNYIPQLCRQLANTYHYYLHANNEKHMKKFLPDEKPEDDIDKYPNNCFFDIETWKFKDFDIEVIDLNKKSHSLRNEKSHLWLCHERSAGEMYFQFELDGKQILGMALYLPFKNGKEMDPSYVTEGLNVTAKDEPDLRPFEGYYKLRSDENEQRLNDRGNNAGRDDEENKIEDEETESEGEHENHQPENHLDSVYINVNDESVKIKIRKENTGRKRVKKWICVKEKGVGGDCNVEFESKEFSEDDEFPSSPALVKKWLRDNGTGGEILEGLTVEDFSGRSLPAVEWHWQGRRLINAPCSAKSISHFWPRQVEPLKKDRLQFILFTGEDFRPHRNKLNLGKIRDQTIPEMLSNTKTGRKIEKEKDLDKPRSTRSTLQSKIKDFIQLVSSRCDMQISLPFQNLGPDKEEYSFNKATKLSEKKKVSDFKKGDCVSFNKGRKGEITHVVVKSEHLIKKDRQYLASQVDVNVILLPKPERYDVRQEKTSVPFFKIKTKIDPEKVPKLIQRLKKKKFWPDGIKFEGIDTKVDPELEKVEKADDPKSESFSWEPFDRCRRCREKKTWKIGSDKGVFTSIKPKVIGVDGKEIASKRVDFKLWNDKKFLRNFSYPSKGYSLNLKKLDPGPHTAQFFVDKEVHEKPWKPLLYEAHFTVEPGDPYKIVLVEFDKDLEARLGSNPEWSRFEFEVQDIRGNRIFFKDMNFEIFSEIISVKTEKDAGLKIKTSKLSRSREDQYRFCFEILKISPKDKGNGELSKDWEDEIEATVFHSSLEEGSSFRFKISPGVPDKWIPPDDIKAIRNTYKLLDKSDSTNIETFINDVIAQGKFCDKYGYTTTELPDEKVTVMMKVKSKGEWKNIFEAPKTLERENGRLGIVEETHLELGEEYFLDDKKEKTGKLRARVELKWGKKKSEFRMNVKAHNEPVYLEIKAPDKVKVGEDPKKIQFVVYKDSNIKHELVRRRKRRRSQDDQMNDGRLTVYINGKKIDLEQDYSYNLQIPKKIPGDLKDDKYLVRVEANFDGVEPFWHEKEINLERGDPFKWKIDDDKISWNCSAGTRTKQLTLEDKYENQLKPIAKKSAKLMREGSNKQTLEVVKGKLKVDMKRLNPGDYEIFFDPSNKLKLRVEHSFTKLHVDPEQLDLSQDGKRLLNVNIEARCVCGEVCSDEHGTVTFNYQRGKSKTEEMEDGTSRITVERDLLESTFKGKVTYSGKERRVNIKVPPRPVPPPPQFVWRNVGPDRKTRIESTLNFCDGYLGVLNDYATFRVPRASDLSADQKTKLHKMLSIRLKKILNYVVVDGLYSKMGKWVRKSGRGVLWDTR